MHNDRPPPGDLEHFEESHSPEGLFVRYARGRTGTFWKRQLLPLAGTLPVALLAGPAAGGVALLIAGAGDAAECLVLRRLLERHPDGRLPGCLRRVAAAAATLQALAATCVIWMLWRLTEDPSGHPVLIAILAGAAANAGVAISHVPRLVGIKLAVYACGAVAMLASEVAAGAPRHAILNEMMAMLLAAQLMWLTLSDVRRSFGRRIATRRQVLHKTMEAEEAQRRLAANEAENRRLALVARHATDSVFITDSDYRIEYVNEAFTRLSGFRPEEVVGKDPRALFGGAASNAATGEEISAAIRDRRQIRADVLSYAKDGRETWIEVNIAPLFDDAGRPTGYVNVAREVTQAKRREAELSRLSLVASHANDGVVIADHSGSIEYVNEAFLRMTGLARAEAIGRKVRSLFADPEADPDCRERLSNLTSPKRRCRPRRVSSPP